MSSPITTISNEDLSLGMNEVRNDAVLPGLEHDLDNAVDRGEFELNYQPKVALKDLRPAGAEALLRWYSPRHGNVPPDLFVPLADQSGRIEGLTWFVLNAALRHLSEWPVRPRGLTVAINLTPSLLENDDLPQLIADAMGLWNTPAGSLTVEVTESALIRKPEQTFGVLKGIQDAGARIAIDDFGTGYSSFSHFKQIPANELKIDKSFVLNMCRESSDRKIVRTIIDLAHTFGLAVTAEGVENARTRDLLQSMDCDFVQGYLYSKALPQTEFVTWLQDYAPAAPALPWKRLFLPSI